MRQKRIVGLGGVVLVALALAWGFHVGPFAKKATTAPPAAPVVVVTEAVTRRDAPETVEVVGTVQPLQTVAIKTRLDSQLIEVALKDGAFVRKGDVLFRLDDKALQADKTRLAAQLVALKAQYERTRKLAERGYATNETLDQNLAAFRAQEALLRSTVVSLGYTVVRSPLTGRAGPVRVTVGNTVKANDTQPLVTINQVDPLVVQAALPQRFYESLIRIAHEGSVPVTARREGSDRTWPGTLDSWDNALDSATGTLPIRVRFANPDESLWPGMFVTLTLDLGTLKNALVLPAKAVQGPEDALFVFVVDPTTTTAHKRPVHIARVLGTEAVVSDGLEEGEIVVTDGLLRLTDGARVAPRSDVSVPPSPEESPSKGAS